ncbi:MAG: hypothetical protein Q7J34_12485 [Bacteroidales bacterium]|nr:hypothetical protein [Bacteroidales bacterium]
MKRYTMLRIRVIWLILLVITFIPITKVFAQEDVFYSTSLEISTLKNGDGSRTVTATLLASGESDELPVLKGEILYYTTLDTEKILLGKSLTNAQGKTTFIIQPDQKLLRDKEGTVKLNIVFEATAALDGAEETLEFKDVRFSMKLIDEDGVKSIEVSAMGIGPNNEDIPVMESDIYFYIQGLFSRLKIGDGWMDNGECTFEFPSDLNGDEVGNLTIFASLEDHSEYGSAMAIEKATWGTHRSSDYTEPSRTLWTRGAPVWMIVTLTILLIGVWSHYMYAIVQLLFIRQEGTQIEKKSGK